MTKCKRNAILALLGLGLLCGWQITVLMSPTNRSWSFFFTENVSVAIWADRFGKAEFAVDSTMNDGQSEEQIPEWMATYFAWHREVRLKFPDKELFEHPDAPNIIVRVCNWHCGGLNDRLSGIPLDLYVANLTQRVLLIKWTLPAALEEFMIPNKVNWTVPFSVGLDTARQINKLPKFKYSRGGGSQMLVDVEQVYKGDISTKKLFTSSCLSGDGPVESLNEAPSFGHIFKSFFRPSPPVQIIMNRITSEYNLINGLYTAVHCRIRHPKGVPRCQGLEGREGGPADRSDISFQQNFTLGKCIPNEKGVLSGSYKDFAINIATHAIDCAHHISPNGSQAVYFMSDSNDTVAFMTGKESPFAGSDVAIASSYTRSGKVLHIDRQVDHNVSDYYAVFVDLFLAANAQCVSYGVGNYGLLAAKISGTKCKIQHRDFIWETGDIAESRNGTQCPPSPYR